VEVEVVSEEEIDIKIKGHQIKYLKVVNSPMHAENKLYAI